VPKQLSDTLTDDLLSFLALKPDGFGIDALVARFGSVASKRTIQRRLQNLIVAGGVVSTGDGRGLRYRVSPAYAASSGSQLKGASDQVAEETSLPLSPIGAELRALVNKPTIERKPVGYNRDFLDSYVPNDTAYLSPEVLEHLRRVGTAPGANHAAGTYARGILYRLLVDLSWASSKLEGNTYSLLETEKLIAMGEAAQGKDALETQMILNHKAAIELIVEGATEPEVGINAYTIRNLHALLANNLLPDPAGGGRVRRAGVRIGGSVYEPLDGGVILEEAFDHLLNLAAEIDDPFEQAFFLMVQLPYLQPFEDVNKRVSRLAANIPLIKNDLSPLSFVEVPQKPYIDGLVAVYELNRVELLRDIFIWAYERSALRYTAVRQSLGEPDPFRMRYREQMKKAVREVVLNSMDASPESIGGLARELGVTEDHVDHFVRLVQHELEALHEGNIARFGLRPGEFETWRMVRSSAWAEPR
jgi:hypothetical protein